MRTHGRVSPRSRRILTIPFDAPHFLLNRFAMKAFNLAYYHRHVSKTYRRHCALRSILLSAGCNSSLEPAVWLTRISSVSVRCAFRRRRRSDPRSSTTGGPNWRSIISERVKDIWAIRVHRACYLSHGLVLLWRLIFRMQGHLLCDYWKSWTTSFVYPVGQSIRPRMPECHQTTSRSFSPSGKSLVVISIHNFLPISGGV